MNQCVILAAFSGCEMGDYVQYAEPECCVSNYNFRHRRKFMRDMIDLYKYTKIIKGKEKNLYLH